MQEILTINEDRSRLYKATFALAILTIFYNLVEGLIATYYGYTDESLALFGFGLDSFIEMLSGSGIAHLVWRIWQTGENERDNFEKNALRMTGFAFYALFVGLLVTAIYNLWQGHKPETTFWGVIISTVSIFVMILMIIAKNRVGKKLDSDAILADSNCTKVCVYMSLILLASSVVYELTTFAYIDIAGTLGIAWLAFKEGKECFEKAAGKVCCSSANC